MVSESEALNALEAVIDPELGVDIVNLGLVYEIRINPEDGIVSIIMTLTSPGCPLGEMITRDIRTALMSCSGVRHVQVDFVWNPPWAPSMVSPLARARLGMR